MNGWVESLAFHLARTTLVTSATVILALWLLWVLRIRSPRWHRAAWLLVLAQGWLLVPFPWRIEADAPTPTAAIVPTIKTTHAAAAQMPVPLVPHATVVEPFDVVPFLTGWSLVVWLVGITTLVVVGAWRYLKLFAAGRPGEPAVEREWLDEWDQVRESSTLRKPAEFRTTRKLGPLVCWVPWVFLVLVPRAVWGSLTRADRLAILRHELAHCERGDLWKNLAVRLLALPQWFNPLVWLAVRRFEEAGEWACDDRVASGTGAMEYAKTLVHIADLPAVLPSGAVGMASGPLSRRVRRLVHFSNKEVREMRGFILPVLLVAVGVLQVVRIERVVAEEPTPLAQPTAPAAAERVSETKPPKNKWAFDKPYVIEPPDILLINAVKIVPRPPHVVEPFDGLLVRAIGGDDMRGPIADAFFVDPEGKIDLGPSYGRVQVANLTIDDAQEAIRKHLAQIYASEEVSVSLAVSAGVQQIVGEHLVGPDGRVNLGSYGSVYVTGLTLEEAKQAIEKQLAKSLVDPEVTVDIYAYNSKKVYVITKCGEGDDIVTVSATGNETVLDVIAQTSGIDDSVKKVWIARHAPYYGKGSETIIPVDYQAITKGEDTSTNHQLWPGDRVYVEYVDKSPLVGVGVNSDAGVVGEVLEYDRYSWAPANDAVESSREKPVNTSRPTSIPTYQTNNSSELSGSKSGKATVVVRWVTDPSKSLRNIEGLGKEEKGVDEGAAVVGDSRMVLGLLKVLEKNEVAEVLVAPKITTFSRRTIHNEFQKKKNTWVTTVRPLDNRYGRIEIVLPAGSAEGQQFRLKLDCVSTANQTLFSVYYGSPNGPAGNGEIETLFALNPGQSCIIRVSDVLMGSEGPDYYFTVTRVADE